MLLRTWKSIVIKVIISKCVVRAVGSAISATASLQPPCFVYITVSFTDDAVVFSRLTASKF